MGEIVDKLSAAYDTGANIVEGAVVGYAMGGPVGATIGAGAVIADETGILDSGTDGVLSYFDSGLAGAAAAAGVQSPGVLPAGLDPWPVGANDGPPRLGGPPSADTGGRLSFERRSVDPQDAAFRQRVDAINVLKASFRMSNLDLWRAFCAARHLGLMDDSLTDEFLSATT